MNGRLPKVWYVAAGYKLPAGVEAYLLHYATELRRHGFDSRIIVFERLPRIEHRYLTAVRERSIPIESLYDRVGWLALMLTALTCLPWAARKAVRGKGQEGGFRVQGSGVRSQEPGVRSQNTELLAVHCPPSTGHCSPTPVARHSSLSTHTGSNGWRCAGWTG